MSRSIVTTTSKMPKITDIIFDCDNTLVLSEELAFEACADLANEILAKHGLKDRFTGSELQSEFVGQNFRGMMVSLQEKYNFKMSDEEFQKYVTMEEDRVIANLKEKLEPCKGVNDVLSKLHESQKYGLSVVSSSALRRVKASIEKVGQDQFFPSDHIFSAASSLPKPTSKPDPAIYLWACKAMDRKPENCVAIEDSNSGVKSAHNAGIWVIGYVGPYVPEKQPEMEDVLTKGGANVIMRHWSEFDKCLAEIEQLSS